MPEPSSWIEALRQRPGLFLGTKSLSSLYHFLNGYRMACDCHQIEDERLGLKIPDDFHEWVAYRTHFKESTSGWCNMIIKTCASEDAAFDRFFELLEEHSQRVPTVVVEIVGPVSTTHRLLELVPGGRSSLVPAPRKVQLVKYTDDPGFFALHGSPHFRDCFHPFLSWMHGFEGGKWLIRDQAAYQEMLRDDEEWQRQLSKEDQQSSK